MAEYAGAAGVRKMKSEPKFERSGFGTIVIVPYESIFERRELHLCCNCASELDSILNTFENSYNAE